MCLGVGLRLRVRVLHTPSAPLAPPLAVPQPTPRLPLQEGAVHSWLSGGFAVPLEL